ncbi:MAG: DUF2516 family protein [Actinomycetes bacterium]
MLLTWVQTGVVYLILGYTLWAFIDCLLRPANAFPAVDRQTKVAWLIFIALAGVFVLVGGLFLGVFSAVLVSYYFVDVRAKVLAITRNRAR